MSEEWKKMEAFLQGAFDFEKIPSVKKRDLKVIDVWNATDLCLNNQNNIFIGGRGSGKSTLINISIQKIKEDNMELMGDASLYCSIRSQDIFKSIDREFTENDLGRFIRLLFKGIFGSFDSFKKEKVKMGYVSKLIANLKFKKIIKKLDLSFTSGTSIKSKIIRSIRSKIAEEVGSVSFSLVDSALVSFGKITFAPLAISYKSIKKRKNDFNEQNDLTKDKDSNLDLSKKSSDQELDENMLLLLNIISKKAQRNFIKKCVIFVDDFHFLPLYFQINFIALLLYISQLLTKNGIITAFKVFSSHDTSTDITAVLGYHEKEFTTCHLEATLKNIDVKRRALESLLIRVLCAENRFKESDVQNYFTRETIDSLVIFSGGHPRRFLQMASRFMNKSRGERNQNVHHFLMLSAAEVINKSRKSLGVQLGVGQDIELKRYLSWHKDTISNLVQWSVTKNKGFFFFLPLRQLREDLELKQWLEDAITVGDILEIEKELVIDKEIYRLIAINPATIYDCMGSFDGPILQYSDVVGIQRGSYNIDGLHALEISGKKIIFFYPSEEECDSIRTGKYANIDKIIKDFKPLAKKVCKKVKGFGITCEFMEDQVIEIKYGNNKKDIVNRYKFKDPVGMIIADGKKKPKIVKGIKDEGFFMEKIKSYFKLKI
ncbi:MAG: hypothetical protein KAT34_06935 [Candidatus Aminicenantes bacterium]|nr:hypothetical protein [Candidatus Aminicenantes bacterium]